MKPTILGKKIAALRESRGLNQETLARRAGLSRMGISKIEKGEVKNPRIDTLEKIAMALGFGSVTNLLDDK